jgi:hypothetical protein
LRVRRLLERANRFFAIFLQTEQGETTDCLQHRPLSCGHESQPALRTTPKIGIRLDGRYRSRQSHRRPCGQVAQFLGHDTAKPRSDAKVREKSDRNRRARISLALKGVKYRALGAASLLRRNLLVYGLGGIVVPFAGIKVIDMVLTALAFV